MNTEPITVDQYVLVLVLARWNMVDILREWEDRTFAEAGFLLA